MQIYHPSASKAYIIDVSPSVGNIHVNVLPNEGATQILKSIVQVN
jgi:hypothetical protein